MGFDPRFPPAKLADLFAIAMLAIIVCYDGSCYKVFTNRCICLLV